jgi:hypothetical protein
MFEMPYIIWRIPSEVFGDTPDKPAGNFTYRAFTVENRAGM